MRKIAQFGDAPLVRYDGAVYFLDNEDLSGLFKRLKKKLRRLGRKVGRVVLPLAGGQLIGGFIGRALGHKNPFGRWLVRTTKTFGRGGHLSRLTGELLGRHKRLTPNAGPDGMVDPDTGLDRTSVQVVNKDALIQELVNRDMASGYDESQRNELVRYYDSIAVDQLVGQAKAGGILPGNWNGRVISGPVVARKRGVFAQVMEDYREKMEDIARRKIDEVMSTVTGKVPQEQRDAVIGAIRDRMKQYEAIIRQQGENQIVLQRELERAYEDMDRVAQQLYRQAGQRPSAVIPASPADYRPRMPAPPMEQEAPSGGFGVEHAAVFAGIVGLALLLGRKNKKKGGE